MKRLLREGLSTLSYYTLRLGPQARGGVRILNYHRVTEAHPNDYLCVPVAAFAEQMRALREAGFQAVGVADVARWVAGNGDVPDQAVAITFDDGFEDNFLYAYPQLSRYGFRACFFIPSGFVEAGQEGARRPEDRPMNIGQLQELARHGHEIGAHSVTHRNLTGLAAQDLAWEVRHCKEVLEQRVGYPVELFCYPAGYYDPSVKAAVEQGGYRAACTVQPGANRLGTDPFTLRRTEISAFDSLWDFEKKLAGAYDWLHAVVQGLHRWARPGRQPGNAIAPEDR